jgi:flavoprotein
MFVSRFLTAAIIPVLFTLPTLAQLPTAPKSEMPACCVPVKVKKQSVKVATAKCTGSATCRACKNCKYCAHCSKAGNSCGICKSRKKKSSRRTGGSL